MGGTPTAIVAPFGRRTEITPDAEGYLSSVTNPADETTTFEYGGGGLLASLTDAAGGETHLSYDSLGRLERDEDQGEGFKELERTDATEAHQVELTTKLGRTSRYKYERLATDDIRREVTDPSGVTRTSILRKDGSRHGEGPGGVSAGELGADPRFGMQAPVAASRTLTTHSGLRLSSERTREATLSDPNDPLSPPDRLTETDSRGGLRTTTVFDRPLGRVTTTTPSGRVFDTEVDAHGRPVRQNVPGLDSVSLTYEDGRVASVGQGTRGSALEYDHKGRVGSFTDALGRTTGFAYDEADRLTQQTTPDGGEIKFGYDANGNLTSLTPPGRSAHGFSHTPVNLPSDYRPPDLESGPQPTRFDWNEDRELTKITRPGGAEVTVDYDSAGRPRTVSQARGATSLSYDQETGQLASLTAPGGERTAFSYDGVLPTAETASGTVEGEVSRTFDNNFRVASESIDGSNTVGYGYDLDGLLTGAGEFSLTRNADNGLLSATALGQTTSNLAHNSFGELAAHTTRAGAAVAYEETYARDNLGRITQKTERRGNTTHTLAYAYDTAGRLETVTKDGQLTARYRYDPNGNRIETTRDGQLPATAAYDAQDRLTRHGETTYTHTAAGDLRTKTRDGQTATYAYDDMGALTSAMLADDTEIAYEIDGQGRRIAKRRDGELEQRFLYGRGLGPVAELDVQGDVKSRFVYATRANVPDYMVRSGHTFRIVTDQLGSPRAVIDAASGQVVQEMDFDEFGRVTRDTNPGFQPFGYAGGLYDRDTELVRFGARDYDPDTGRWTAKDPIGFAGGDPNLYGYALRDPVNLTDPSGLFSFMDVSEGAAGALDGIFLGVPSDLFGIDSNCWGDAHAVGQFGGAIAGSVYSGGLLARGAIAITRGGATATAGSGLAGGGLSGAWQTRGFNPDATMDETATGAAIGLPGGVAGAALTSAARGGNTAAGVAAGVGGESFSLSVSAGHALETGDDLQVAGHDSCGC